MPTAIGQHTPALRPRPRRPKRRLHTQRPERPRLRRPRSPPASHRQSRVSRPSRELTLKTVSSTTAGATTPSRHQAAVKAAVAPTHPLLARPRSQRRRRRGRGRCASVSKRRRCREAGAQRMTPRRRRGLSGAQREGGEGQDGEGGGEGVDKGGEGGVRECGGGGGGVGFGSVTRQNTGLSSRREYLGAKKTVPRDVTWYETSSNNSENMT